MCEKNHFTNTVILIEHHPVFAIWLTLSRMYSQLGFFLDMVQLLSHIISVAEAESTKARFTKQMLG